MEKSRTKIIGQVKKRIPERKSSLGHQKQRWMDRVLKDLGIRNGEEIAIDGVCLWFGDNEPE